MPNFSGVWNLKEQIQAIAAGRWTGIVTGELYAWGSNSYGRLGDNTTVYKSSPIQIGALTTWSQVSAGRALALQLRPAESYTHGVSAAKGSLGHNNTISRSSPVQVGALTNWSQVSIGTHTSAVKTDGTLWAWGVNVYGQLGDTTTVYKSSPIQVGALTNWSQVSAGNFFTAAITTERRLVWLGAITLLVSLGTTPSLPIPALFKSALLLTGHRFRQAVVAFVLL
jgi:alpha-tubulin suppressor-like RCC1 family protein